MFRGPFFPDTVYITRIFNSVCYFWNQRTTREFQRASKEGPQIKNMINYSEGIFVSIACCSLF